MFGVDYSWHCVMIPSDPELLEELRWACNPKRASRWPEGKPVALGGSAFYDSLTKWEVDNLH
eukprot:8304099-Pyramimonas_sp.AAC.1